MRFRNTYLKITTCTFIVLVSLTSCKQESENTVKEPPKTPLKQINSGFKEEELFHKYIDDIDNNKDLYVPIYDYNDTFNREENYPWRFNISDNLLFDVDGVETYEFNNENDYKTFIRDIKLKSLL